MIPLTKQHTQREDKGTANCQNRVNKYMTDRIWTIKHYFIPYYFIIQKFNS